MISHSAPPPQPSATRIQVERIRLGQVIGWLAGPDPDALGALRWLVDGQPQPTALQWQARDDVAASTGLPARGFVLDLPADTWLKAAGGARLALAAADAELALATLPPLADWLAEQRATGLAVGEDGRTWFPAADAPHIQRLGAAAALTPAGCAHWTQADQAWLAAQSAGTTQLRPGPLLGWLEGRQGLRLHGWAWRCGAATPALRLIAGTAVLSTPVGWVSRVDAWVHARAGDPAAPQAIGFDLPLPAGIWSHAHGEAVVLRVGGGGAVLDGEAVLLTRADVLTQWQHAADDAGALTDDDLRLLLDHSAAAGAWPAADDPMAGFVRHQALRLGAAQQLPPALRPPASPWAPPATWTTQAVWQLLRELNSAVTAEGDNAAAAISQLLADPRCEGEVGQGFLRSILPYAYAHGALQTVLAHVRLPELRALADSDDAWALSVGLPVWAQLGEWEQALSLLERLALRPNGWLNTEAIHAAAALALAGDTTAPPAAYWTSLVRVLEAEAAAVDGRSHDRHLLDTLAMLALDDESVPVDAHCAALACAWSHHRFNPDWWRALQRHQSDPSLWPLALSQAHGHLDTVQAFLADCATTVSCHSDGVLAALWPVLALIGQPQPGPWSTTHQVATECILAAWPHVQHADALTRQRLATWAGAGEWLRFAQHPAARALDPPSNTHLLLTAATSWLPSPHAAAARRRAMAHFACVAAGAAPLPDPDADVWDALAAPGNQAVALRLAAWALWRATLAHDARAATRWAGALMNTRQRLPGASDHAPALREAGVWLARAHAANPQDPGLAQLVHEWGCAAAPQDDALTTFHQLVVCVVCESSRLASVEAQVAATWGKSLREHAVPWQVVAASTAEGEDAVLAMDGGPQASQRSGAAADLEDHAGHDRVAPHRVHLRGPHGAPRRGSFWVALAQWAAATHANAHVLCMGADQALEPGRLLQDVPHWGCDVLAQPDPADEKGEALDWRAGVMLSAHGLARLGAQARRWRVHFDDDARVGGAWLALWLRESNIAVSQRGWSVRREEHLDGGPVRVRAPAVLPELAVTRPAESPQANHIGGRGAWIWPTWAAARMGTDADQPLQLLRLATVTGNAATAAGPAVTLVGVLRDECVLLPHFLAHYRHLGVRHFVLADNGSSDGSVQWLLAQDDVTLYHVGSEYRRSHYGVLWQQAMLAAHCQQQWALLADLDEFAVLPHGHSDLTMWLQGELRARPDANATLFQMIDRYPDGDLALADFSQGEPFSMAPKQDEPPCLPWHLGSGAYSNAASWVSAMRHRLLPGSSPTDYTSQKVALVRYAPWMRFAEGLHYASNVRLTGSTLAFAHFKYHKGFQDKVEREIARGQHFNAAQEYRNYQHMQF